MRTGSGSLPQANSSVSPAASELRALFLVGFMGAGKSTVGEALAEILGWAFEDLDQRIERRTRLTIEQIFQQQGEAGFRQAETSALRELLDELNGQHKVIALGGGAFVQAENAELIRAARLPTVFLDAPVDELFQRCQRQGSQRPLRRDAGQFRQLYEARQPFYACAEWRIDTSGKNISAIAAEIAANLKLR